MFIHHRRIQWKWALGAALLAALLLTGVTLAYYIDVNTNDGIWDTDWTNRPNNVTDAPADGIDSYDIQAVWMSRTDPGSGTQYFNFLVQMDNALPFPSGLVVIAQLSCDDDTLYNESEDRWVWYTSGTSDVMITDGTQGSPTTPDATLGEDISWTLGITRYGTEFKAPLTNMGNCATAGNIRVKVQSYQDTTFSDEASAFRFNVPTAIELVSVEGRSASNLPLVLAGAAAAVLLGLSLALRRRKV